MAGNKRIASAFLVYQAHAMGARNVVFDHFYLESLLCDSRSMQSC